MGEFSWDELSISEDEIGKLIGAMRENKAPGVDGISARFLREGCRCITTALRMIFERSFRFGEVPEDWRRANVAPLFKKGKVTEVGNYRPVSLTSLVGKLLEKMIKNKIVDYLDTRGVILDSQHGFRSARSCLTNLLSFWSL